MENYKGYKTIKLTDFDLAAFYQGDIKLEHLEKVYENEYVLLANSNGEIVDKYCYQNGEMTRVFWRPFKTELLGQVKPLNLTQELGFHMLQSNPSTIKVFDCDYGVGKSFLCANYIFEALRIGKFEKAVLIRPNIGLEDYPSLGAVPGDYLQKSFPWFAMLCDIVGSKEIIMSMIEREQLELAPMETLRGRSFNNSIIYVEECGNLTSAACRLIVSRCGENSQILMCGDQSQTDKKRFREDSGLAAMRDALVGNPLFSYLKLEGCVRSKTAQLCELF